MSQAPESPAEGGAAGTVPAAPLDAALPVALLGPVVVGQVLHGQGVLAQRALVLAVLAPDLVKVAHLEHKQTEDVSNAHRARTERFARFPNFNLPLQNQNRGTALP